MGMYTELNCAFRLKENTDKTIIDLLRHMTGEEMERPTAIPAHALFGDTRWLYMLQCDSYYFEADTRSTVRYDDIAKQVMVTIQCNLKNYNHEIELFIEWITPYIDALEGEFLGHKRYEEDELPTLLIFPNRWVNVSVAA